MHDGFHRNMNCVQHW